MSNDFIIYVTGDAGRDVFTYSLEERRPARLPRVHLLGSTEYDLHVPSGAAFASLVLKKLLEKPDSAIKIELLARFGLENPENKIEQALRPFLGTCAGRHSTGQPDDETEQELTPLPPILTHVKQQYEKSSGTDKKNRIGEFNRFIPGQRNESETSRCNFSSIASTDMARQLLIIHDGGAGWSTFSDTTKLTNLMHTFSQSLSQPLKESWQGLPRILVNISKKLPELGEKGAKTESQFQSMFWNQLQACKDRVGIVVSLSTLRRAGAAISRRLSWEQTVEDLAAELHLFPPLQALSQFRHLFVRAGMVGVIHIENDHNKVRGKVYFTPYAKDGIHRDPDLEGRTVGKNTLLIASLAYQISQTLGKGPGEKTAALRDGIKAAIRAAMQVDDQGYEGDLFPTKETLTEEDRVIRGAQLIRQSVAPAADIICPAKTSGTGGKEEPSVIIACRPIPGYLLAEPLPEDFRCTKRWHILDDVLEQAPVPRINVAMAIVMAGHQHVLNRLWGKGAQKTEAEKDIWAILTRADYWNPQDRAPDYVTLNDGDRPAMPDRSGKNMPRLIGNIEKPFGFNVPIAQFDKLTVAEREEIDGLRSISNLLKLYMRDRERNTKPISIAVFGPPGSGKSFAVKQIAETIDDQKAIQPLEYNVAQFRTVEDLGGVFTKVSSVNNQDRTPLVFFDEFDSVLNDQPLGWLKYFLAPMQDGTFQGDNIGRAIFVFAGGIHTSFEKFDPRTAPPDEELGYKISDDYKQRVRQFTEQKGPDFISRLRGHMNILPVNTEPGRIKHFIRRALQLRSMCERFSFTFTHPQDTKYRMAAVDEAVLYALLTIDCYRHGVRSMEAIVQMCTPIDGRIQLSSLPSQAQLNMHVDAEEFFIRLYRGRWRAACEGGPKGRDVMVLLELWSRLEQLFTPQEAAEIHDQIKQKYQNRHTR